MWFEILPCHSKQTALIDLTEIWVLTLMKPIYSVPSSSFVEQTQQLFHLWVSKFSFILIDGFKLEYPLSRQRDEDVDSHSHVTQIQHSYSSLSKCLCIPLSSSFALPLCVWSVSVWLPLVSDTAAGLTLSRTLESFPKNTCLSFAFGRVWETDSVSVLCSGVGSLLCFSWPSSSGYALISSNGFL